MKTLVLCFSLLLFASSSSAQITATENKPEPCNLSLANAPDLQGLKLGMSVDEVSKYLGVKVELKDEETLFLNMKESPPKNHSMFLGVKSFSATDFAYSNLKDVKLIELTFFKEAVNSINLTYRGNYKKWTSLDEFLDSISKKLRLPRESWQSAGTSLSILNCEEFEMSANIQSYGENNYNLSIDDGIAGREIYKAGYKKYLEARDSEKQKEESKKKVFKH